ncbi:12457_t:CDS:2, partial [Racocetra persica]
MPLCDECSKPIIGDKFVFNPEKNDGKQFCSQICCENYYAPNCSECGKKARLGLHKNNIRKEKEIVEDVSTGNFTGV